MADMYGSVCRVTLFLRAEHPLKGTPEDRRQVEIARGGANKGRRRALAKHFFRHSSGKK